VSGLLGANPVMAQGGFRFTSPVDVAIGSDDGFLARGQKLTDNIMVVRPPQPSFTGRSPRASLTVSYQPEIELFDKHRDLNALNHKGTASFTFRMTERLNFNAGDDALMTKDPTRSIPGSLIFLPRQSFKQNMAHAAINYLMTRRNTVSFSFDNVVATGRVRNAGTVSLAHTFGRKQTLTSTYSFLTANAQFGGVSYEGAFANDLTVHLSTGLLKDGGENYLMSAQVEKRLGVVWVTGGYNRFLSVFGTSIPGGVPIGNDLVLPVAASRTSIYQVFSTGVYGNLSSRTGLEVGVGATKSNSGTANRDINNISGHFKLDYLLTERLKIYADVQSYNQTFDVFVGAPIDRRRYVAGIQFDISSQPNRVSNVPQRTKPTPR
jgi:hypothetical protein